MRALVERVRSPRNGQRVVVADAAFPPTDWRGPELQGVDFIRCDLTRLRFRGSRFHSITLMDCSFEDAELPSFHKMTIAGCRFTRSTLNDFNGFFDSRIVDSTLERCRLDSAQATHSEFRRVKFLDVRATHPFLSGSQLIETQFTGRVKTAVFSRCVFDAADFSGLHMRDSSIGGEFRRPVMFPRFPDSFVVRRESLTAVEPALERELTDRSMRFYRSYVTHLSGPYVVIDDETFNFDRADFDYAMSEAEAQVVVRALYPLSLKSSGT